ncbi:MAG: type II secretion system F family protein [Myxococcota bacterium]
MNEFLASTAAGWLSVLMVGLGSGAAVWILAADEDGPLRRNWDRYVNALDAEVRFLFLKYKAEHIARAQVGGVVAMLIFAQLTGNFLPLVLAAAIATIPYIRLRALRVARVQKLEQQLDGWLLLLANSLKATPAIGEAIKSTVALVSEPISQELDLLVKENQLGTPLDQAILNASERINSPIVSSSLAMLVVARQTGGDLPTILETSAGSLREMARLEGVVRTKTAEGRGQVWVLGAMPWMMALALNGLDETWWPTLSGNFIGNVVLGVAIVAWTFAILWGRQILAVDI